MVSLLIIYHVIKGVVEKQISETLCHTCQCDNKYNDIKITYIYNYKISACLFLKLEKQIVFVFVRKIIIILLLFLICFFNYYKKAIIT